MFGEGVDPDQRRITRIHRLGDSEIDQFGPIDVAVRENDISRRDVAVNDPLRVNFCKAASQSLEQRQHLVWLEPPPRHDRLQRFALDEFHDEKAQSLFVALQSLVFDDRVIAHAAELADFGNE